MDDIEIRAIVGAKTTGCECVRPGYCCRHAIYKPPEAFKYCAMNPGCFVDWENCRGAGQEEDCDKYRKISGQEKLELQAEMELKQATEQESKGFGDTLTKIIHGVHLDILSGNCIGCNKRRRLLNKLFPYRERK